MKQTFYLYETLKSQNSMGKIKMFAREVCSLQNDVCNKLLGTVELDVEPIKKEVEKVIEKPMMHIDMRGIQIVNTLPPDAYNVKVTYTVKE